MDATRAGIPGSVMSLGSVALEAASIAASAWSASLVAILVTKKSGSLRDPLSKPDGL
jgi:hypothetical protein